MAPAIVPGEALWCVLVAAEMALPEGVEEASAAPGESVAVDVSVEERWRVLEVESVSVSASVDVESGSGVLVGLLGSVGVEFGSVGRLGEAVVVSVEVSVAEVLAAVSVALEDARSVTIR
jgi:hypothetical protein